MMSLGSSAAARIDPSCAPISHGGYGGKLRRPGNLVRDLSLEWLPSNEF